MLIKVDVEDSVDSISSGTVTGCTDVVLIG